MSFKPSNASVIALDEGERFARLMCMASDGKSKRKPNLRFCINVKDHPGSHHYFGESDDERLRRHAAEVRREHGRMG